MFAQLTKRDGSFIVGRTDEEFSWDILRGKTIIGGRKGGVPEMTLEYIMKQNGVVPGEDSNVDTSVQFDMMAGAFTGGNGDYVTLFEPTATEIEMAGQGYILASLGEESGEIPYTAYFAAEDYMAENPDVIQGFANAVAKGQQWIEQHSGQEIAEVIAGYFPDTDVDVLAQVADRYKSIDAWSTTPVMEEESQMCIRDSPGADGVAGAQHTEQEISHNRRGQHKGQSEYNVQNALQNPRKLCNIIRRQYSQKENYNSGYRRNAH